MNVYINTIQFNKSLVDGPGVRTLVFFQGCNLKCKGCQNKSLWNIKNGTKMEVHDLAELIKKHSFNKKVTITGGEPLMQTEALLELLKELKGFDIALYTGHQKGDIPVGVFALVKYIKYGPFIEKLKTTTKPYVGSTNQKFIMVGENKYETEYKR